MREVDRISEQLRRAFEGGAWHGPSVREVLKGVTAEIASRRPIAKGHTIWEIVQHIDAWQIAGRRRVELEFVKVSDAEDWPAVTGFNENAWNAALETINKSYEQLQSVIKNLDDSKLDNKVPGAEYTIYVVLHGVIQHDLFHAGQIALLKK
jgi:uncharacterized damage-inducible protein DinB